MDPTAITFACLSCKNIVFLRSLYGVAEFVLNQPTHDS
jgi:hypothetical protein